MKKGWLQQVYRPIKRVLPGTLGRWIRALATGIITPLRFSVLSGHFRSSIAGRAVDRQGEPVPWYTYPALSFLDVRDFRTCSVLEIGAGQSTIWWAKRAGAVQSFETDPGWLARIRPAVSGNATLHLVDGTSASMMTRQIETALRAAGCGAFDIVLVDGKFRYASLDLAMRWVAERGMVLVDNAEWPGFRNRVPVSGWYRVDFFGHAPGVVLQHCTAIYFREGSTYFNTLQPCPGGESRTGGGISEVV